MIGTARSSSVDGGPGAQDLAHHGRYLIRGTQNTARFKSSHHQQACQSRRDVESAGSTSRRLFPLLDAMSSKSGHARRERYAITNSIEGSSGGITPSRSNVLGGCVVVHAQGYYGGTVVAVAPPAPQVEVAGIAPTPGFFWFDGYWNWIGSRHIWVGGHWGPGRAGYHWVPHTWVRAGRGWRMHEGHWAR